MAELTFNIDNGYLEGLVRGFKGGVLRQTDYLNLVQCETLEGMKGPSICWKSKTNQQCSKGLHCCHCTNSYILIDVWFYMWGFSNLKLTTVCWTCLHFVIFWRRWGCDRKSRPNTSNWVSARPNTSNRVQARPIASKHVQARPTVHPNTSNHVWGHCVWLRNLMLGK